MIEFSATFETVRPGTAIVTLFDKGEWSGSGRVEIRSTVPSHLYEAAYIHAARSAWAKNGELRRFTEARAPAENCPHRCLPEAERRPANALNVEIGSPLPRCNLKRPDHWPAGSSSLRWLASGGSPLVFGICNLKCPKEEP